MRPKGSKEELEIRRRTAVALYQQGLSVREVAERVGCAPASVSRWNQSHQRAGTEGLKSKPQSGSKPRLSDEQLDQLRRYLEQGARAHGWKTELWTLSRIAKLLEDKFGVRYHISHVHRILHKLGFSAQKPERRARQQDRAQVDAFRHERWLSIKKSPAGGAKHRFHR